MWTETARWYEEIGRDNVAISLYMELIGLSGAKGYPTVEWEIIKEFFASIGRAYHASGDLYKALGWIHLILKAIPAGDLSDMIGKFYRDAVTGMFSWDGDQEHQLFSQELRLIVTQGRPHLFGTSFCYSGDFVPWAWSGEDHLAACVAFAPSPYASYSRTCPAIDLPTVLNRAVLLNHEDTQWGLVLAAEDYWLNYV
jgi:hypothetical protein